VNPLFALLDAEFAHSLAVKAAAHGFVQEKRDLIHQFLG